MKIGDRVFVLSGLDVEEWEVYAIREDGPHSGPWIRRNARMGCALSLYRAHYIDLMEAVEASKKAREREVKRMARALERLAINTGVKVRMMKKPRTENPKSTFQSDQG